MITRTPVWRHSVRLLALLLLSLTGDAWALTYNPNQQIKAVGVQNDIIYFTFPSSGSCYIWYANPTTPSGNSATFVNHALSAVTAAYLSGKIITRIDYTQTSNNCHANLIQF